MSSHTGSDGSKPYQRAERYGDRSGGYAENLAFGINDGAGYIYQLYIDDGVSSRGHRKSIILPNFRKTGIAYCKHSITSGMLIVTYAGDFK